MIDGSDEAVEGTWVFTSTSKEVPYLSWVSGQPSDGTNRENCLLRAVSLPASAMYDLRCSVALDTYRYLCEYESKCQTFNFLYSDFQST